MVDLPPSDQFERYLTSPFHARRVAAAHARTTERMRNFAHGEVYPAISELIGTLIALAEFYSDNVKAPRSIVSALAGDPVKPRTAGRPRGAASPAGSADAPMLTVMERNLLMAMSDGRPRTRKELLADMGSKALAPVTVNAKLSYLRKKLATTGVEIVTGPGPTYAIVGSGCELARKLAGG